MNDNTARGSLSTRSPLFSTHCKKFFSNEPDFSLIEQFVTWNHQNQENTLSNLKRCDAARLENFYRSAFEGLDLQACEAILHLWRGSLSREVLFGIQNTCSKELTRPGLCFQDLSSFTHTDDWRYARRSLSYIARKPWVEIPFKRLLEALRFVSIETTDRKNVEALYPCVKLKFGQSYISSQFTALTWFWWFTEGSYLYVFQYVRPLNVMLPVNL